ILPSVTDLIFMAVLFSLSYSVLTAKLLGDAGIGWHIRNGELMLRTHAVTRVDVFSYTMSGRPWLAWEWLYDVIIGAVHQWLGLNGVVLFTAMVIACTFALTFRILLDRGSLVQISLVLLLLAMGAAMIHFLARPHVLSWLFTFIWFHLLDSAEISPKKRKRLFFLPLLMLLWVNLHGGFLFGLALFGLYWIAGMIEYWRKTALGDRPAAAEWMKQLSAVAALSFLATFANPYGYRLHAHVYHYLSNRFLMNHIDEFRSPDFHGIAQECFAVLLVVTIIAFYVARGKVRASQLLVVLFASYSGLYASRNLPVASILLILVAGPLLSAAVRDAANNSELPSRTRRFLSRCSSFAMRMGGLEQRLRGHLWPVAAVIFGLFVCIHGGKLGSHQLMSAHFDDKRFPVQAAEVIAERGIHEPIFTLDSWGGYFIYRFYPNMKVFVDDRHDLYGEQFLREYLTAIRLAPGWDKVLDERHINWVLMPRGSSLANMLEVTRRWRVAYSDQVAVLLEREQGAGSK
ncbi:MAG TPA: hypothetical protein VGV15_10910, partial [Terriglobales bacterium]|nr:hypothetical protein [Terriglobales bacterium]